MQTINEQRALTERQLLRIERANPDHFRFPREMPRQQRRTPFVADRRELRDAVIGLVAFVGLVAALATAPWWLS